MKQVTQDRWSFSMRIWKMIFIKEYLFCKINRMIKKRRRVTRKSTMRPIIMLKARRSWFGTILLKNWRMRSCRQLRQVHRSYSSNLIKCACFYWRSTVFHQKMYICKSQMSRKRENRKSQVTGSGRNPGQATGTRMTRAWRILKKKPNSSSDYKKNWRSRS